MESACRRFRCPSDSAHGEGLTRIENAHLMILTEMKWNGVSLPADEAVPDRVVLTFTAEGEAE